MTRFPCLKAKVAPRFPGVSCIGQINPFPPIANAPTPNSKKHPQHVGFLMREVLVIRGLGLFSIRGRGLL